MSILPIGSVIKAEQMKLMVVGHFSKVIDNKNQYFYMAVPYPVGYVGTEKLLTLKVDAEVEVLHEGFQTEGGLKHINNLENYAKLSAVEVKLVTEVMKEAVKNMKGGK